MNLVEIFHRRQILYILSVEPIHNNVFPISMLFVSSRREDQETLLNFIIVTMTGSAISIISCLACSHRSCTFRSIVPFYIGSFSIHPFLCFQLLLLTCPTFSHKFLNLPPVPRSIVSFLVITSRPFSFLSTLGCRWDEPKPSQKRRFVPTGSRASATTQPWIGGLCNAVSILSNNTASRRLFAWAEDDRIGHAMSKRWTLLGCFSV